MQQDYPSCSLLLSIEERERERGRNLSFMQYDFKTYNIWITSNGCHYGCSHYNIFEGLFSSLTPFILQVRMGRSRAMEMCGGTCGGNELLNLPDRISLNLWTLEILSYPMLSFRILPFGTFTLFIAGKFYIGFSFVVSYWKKNFLLFAHMDFEEAYNLEAKLWHLYLYRDLSFKCLHNFVSCTLLRIFISKYVGDCFFSPEILISYSIWWVF